MEQIKLSKRLHTVAHLIEQGRVVADIGTDHGYLPIYIIKNHISDHVIAMDVRKGPLEKAKQNVKVYEVAEHIDLRLSDGLEKLEPSEADAITICGMGGKLIQSILTKGKDKVDAHTQLIVSPQSEISDFRMFLKNNGFTVNQELMLKEDNQFYLIIDCRWDQNAVDDDREDENKEIQDIESNKVRTQMFLRYGHTLLERGDQTLHEYLLHEQTINEKVATKLTAIEKKDEAVLHRLEDIAFDRKCIEEALKYYQS